MTQPALFPPGDDRRLSGDPLHLRRDQLQHWQAAVASHQQTARRGGSGCQGELFAAAQASLPCGIDPFLLLPQPLNFWRWPVASNEGAAHYFVIDAADHLPHPLLLYVGETGQAAQRWKGSHDCKAYLATYLQALQTVELAAAVSVRFWCDAPLQRTARRAQEARLIHHWRPPFNRQTQGRWRTPFTALAD
ncbi:MAG: GIY-YIG nuclease family protein [Cyanobacteria bacterium MAG CAR4_bin_6]|nr:GIY-YIG nuclease family protein [Cyanobacteria bacterium MAG CAR4_bin_6]MCY4235305.1 GIY-YIG nuclease family protein [Cyanobacteria bacterium MAG CAR2_bin_4]